MSAPCSPDQHPAVQLGQAQDDTMDGTIPPNDAPLTHTEAEGATVDLPEGLGFFTTGQVLGERYEVLEMLGRGGMGEVWRAFDLKLRVEVGLKALREELFRSERRLELLRRRSVPPAK